MRAYPLSILAIFAHPDDEIGVGSTLAHYSDAGVLTDLVCASRGEAATIYCDGCATRENLADVRTHELECACRNLGMVDLLWLDWPDGGIQALPRDQAVGRVVRAIRHARPDVIITHPENGLYPHPDHLAMFEITRAAFEAAADPARYPQAGQPWAAARLFSRALPQSLFDAAGFGTARVELNGELLPYYATPDAELDVAMHVIPWADRRMAAWNCHVSQQNPDSAMARMPDGLRRSMAENEYFVLVDSRAPLPASPAGEQPGDLLAGLDDWPERESSGGYAEAVRAALAARRAYFQIYQVYQREARNPTFQALLETLADREQEFIYILAGALRRTDYVVARVEPDQRALDQAQFHQNLDAQARFLRAQARHAVNWYRAQAAHAEDEAQQTVWAELEPLAEANRALTEEYAAAF